MSYFSGFLPRIFWWFIIGDVSHETFTDVGLMNVNVMFSGIVEAESGNKKK